MTEGPLRIVVTRRPPGSVLEVLGRAGDVVLWPEDLAMPRAELEAAATHAHGLYCMLTDVIDDSLLAAAPALRVVSSMAVGVDNVDLDACTRRGIPVGHTPGVLSDTVADMAIGLLLAASRRIMEGVDYVREGRWKTWEPDLLWGTDVHGATVGIIGFGGVGRAVARRLTGFNCSVLAYNRTRPSPAEAPGVRFVELDHLYEAADHVVVAIALTDETRHIVDRSAFDRMKPTATLVNISRGGTVDQAALTAALRSGAIGAAALDVTDPEPMSGDDPLLDLPNCVVIPHLGSSTVRTRQAMADLAARNLLAGLHGKPLVACANPAVYEP